MKIAPIGKPAQQLRLYSGLVLFTYAGFHFLNHALGLISIDAMLAFEQWRQIITRSSIGGPVLIISIVMHPSLALAKFAMRSTLKMPFWEALQILLGISIPWLLLPHIINTRLANAMFNVTDDYNYVLGALWPGKAWEQSILLLIVWTHGCIGLHFWLRVSSGYRKISATLLALAVALPLLGLAGFTVAARNLAAEKAAKATTAPNPYSSGYGEDEDEDDGYGDEGGYSQSGQSDYLKTLTRLETNLQYGFLGLLGLAGFIFSIRLLQRNRAPKITIDYQDGPVLHTPSGPTLLEISRKHSIPHASVCGGRARCSTCRAHITKGLEHLPPPGPTETATLARVNASPDMRLACQITPKQELGVSLVLRPDSARKLTADFMKGESQGVERDMAVLFLDIRGFTAMSAGKLPYDVIFLLNQLFDAAGAAICAEDGWIDKYMGDGLMAVFGRECSCEEACAQALRAAKAIDLALDGVNSALAEETGSPMKIGIGIHAGQLVMGHIGEARSAAITVIGRTVNTAARLEALTKEKSSQLIISEKTARLAGLDINAFKRESVKLRGLPEPLDILIIGQARDLPQVDL